MSEHNASAPRLPEELSEASTIEDLPDEIAGQEELEDYQEVEIPEALQDPVDPGSLEHRDFENSEFWKKIPGFADVSREEFMDYRFQVKKSVTSVDQLEEILGDLVAPEFLDDVRSGMDRAPMSMRVSPYILSLIDWDHPYEDPLRIQFIPVGSTQMDDHPLLMFDSLAEQDDSPTPGLVHRYPDKVLFLALDVCPVYCRFCTRSYAIGGDVETHDKVNYRPSKKRWGPAFAYIAARPEVEDVVLSGGDLYMLAPGHLEHILEVLLSIPHVRRIRLATKGPAVMPMKILSHDEWTDVVVRMAEKGRELHKEVCLHTHFNSPNEITEISREAMNYLWEKGVIVRNQSVLIRGVNDDPETMVRFTRQLAYMNVQPYYVYQHDMVKHVEELRTTVGQAIEIERRVRGSTAGFMTPTFVNDVPGGGGKRDVHSLEYYDEVTGVSVYRSPAVDEDRIFLYFDPIHLLPEEGRKRWADQGEHAKMVREAIEAAGMEGKRIATDVIPQPSLVPGD